MPGLPAAAGGGSRPVMPGRVRPCPGGRGSGPGPGGRCGGGDHPATSGGYRAAGLAGLRLHGDPAGDSAVAVLGQEGPLSPCLPAPSHRTLELIPEPVSSRGPVGTRRLQEPLTEGRLVLTVGVGCTAPCEVNA